MFIIKNAIKNIYRYRNRYILFAILYSITILSTTVCVNIFVQTRQITENVIKEYAGIVRIIVSGSLPRFTKDEYWKYMDKEYIYNIEFLKYNFATNWVKEDVLELDVEININGEIRALDGLMLRPTYIFGYNMSLLHLVSNEFNLESGRMFERDDEAVIAKNSLFNLDDSVWDEHSETSLDLTELISWNDLDLGNKIVIKNDNGIYKEFTVVGIQAEDSVNNMYTNRRMIYTTFESASYFDNIASDRRGNSVTAPPTKNSELLNPNFFIEFNPLRNVKLGYDVIAYLYSPEKFDNLRLKMFATEMDIEPLFPNYRTLINLIIGLQNTAIIFTLLLIFIIVIITIIATIILLNLRKYEMAVLRSMGMKKSQFILSYLVENLAFIWGIALAALIAAQFIAPLFTSRMFKNMRDLMSPESFTNLTQSKNLELILQNAGLVFSGITAIVVFALVIACIYIIRFEPLKIFNKQY